MESFPLISDNIQLQQFYLAKTRKRTLFYRYRAVPVTHGFHIAPCSLPDAACYKGVEATLEAEIKVAVFLGVADSRQGVNGSLRTTPGSVRSNHHVVLYSSRERLNVRNGELGQGGSLLEEDERDCLM